MKLIEEENLVEAAEKKGAMVVETLVSAGIGKVKEVRGKGMMIGMELDGPARDVFLKAMEQGLLVCYAGKQVLRLAPPLTIDESDLSRGLEILIDVLKG